MYNSLKTLPVKNWAVGLLLSLTSLHASAGADLSGAADIIGEFRKGNATVDHLNNTITGVVQLGELLSGANNCIDNARNLEIIVVNATQGHELRFDSGQQTWTTSGKFGTAPKAYIPAGGTDVISVCSSNGAFMTGVVGAFAFELALAGEGPLTRERKLAALGFAFSNPYSGGYKSRFDYVPYDVRGAIPSVTPNSIFKMVAYSAINHLDNANATVNRLNTETGGLSMNVRSVSLKDSDYDYSFVFTLFDNTLEPLPRLNKVPNFTQIESPYGSKSYTSGGRWMSEVKTKAGCAIAAKNIDARAFTWYDVGDFGGSRCKVDDEEHGWQKSTRDVSISHYILQVGE
jgi:hypothetical protein